RRLTTTEQIVWAHRVDKSAQVTPGSTVRVYADLLPASDGTAPFAIHTFNQITGGNAIEPRQAAIANDHFVFTGREPPSSTSPSPSRGSCFPVSSFPAPTRTAAPMVRTVRSGSAWDRPRSD